MANAALLTEGSVDRIERHLDSIEFAMMGVVQGRRKWWRSEREWATILDIRRCVKEIEREMREAQDRFENEDARFKRYRREDGD